MRVKPLVLIALVCVLAAGLHAQQQITLMATIVDPTTGATVETLDPSEVRVIEDGVEGETVRVEVVNRVVKVHLLIDNGIGIGSDNIGELRKGVRGLIEALPPGLETTIVTTAPQPRFLVRATKDRAALLKGVDLLSPDTGAGRFVESISEAAQRSQREKEDTFTVIIAAGTSSGDGNVLERDIERLFERVESRPTMVHVVLFSGGVGRSATGGIIQSEVGLALTKNTGGRYENINAMSRYVTLLPELGAEVAKNVAAQSRQFRIIAQRPDGKKGDLGRISLGVSGKLATDVTLERR